MSIFFNHFCYKCNCLCYMINLMHKQLQCITSNALHSNTNSWYWNHLRYQFLKNLSTWRLSHGYGCSKTPSTHKVLVDPSALCFHKSVQGMFWSVYFQFPVLILIYVCLVTFDAGFWSVWQIHLLACFNWDLICPDPQLSLVNWSWGCFRNINVPKTGFLVLVFVTCYVFGPYCRTYVTLYSSKLEVHGTILLTPLMLKLIRYQFWWTRCAINDFLVSGKCACSLLLTFITFFLTYLEFSFLCFCTVM
jgi:hypothetical protein